jgi:diguanylate cyclase (GGDEF)-like protein/PAS domain S-box-containing protein
MYIRQDHEFKYVNRKFKEMLGYADDEELKNIPINKIIDEESLPVCAQIYDKILKGEKVENPYLSIFRKKNGEKIYVEITINPTEYEGRPAVQGFVRDVTEKKLLENKLKEMNEKLKELSIKDELTGLYNYRYFKNKLKEKFLESKRYNIPISLIVIDIDDFKKINDTYGHLAGDYILKELGKILVTNVRATDIVARYGGEEFVILLPFTEIKKASEIAKRIVEAVRNRDFIYELNVINITISAGISSITNDRQIKTENDLLKVADDALYKVKGSGKDNFYHF